MLEQIFANWSRLNQRVMECRNLFKVVQEENDEEYFKELELEALSLAKEINQLETQSFLSGEQDSNNAYMAIHAGAGGTEAQDWSAMLHRMYLRWLEKKQFKTEIISFIEGDEAGVKSTSIKIQGLYAFGYLKGETGVHRLVRISPFDSNSRRHTSFSSVFVWPEAQDDIDIQIKTEDLRVDTYRASGAGGQHVNKTDSAVRITHLPTGRTVQCQNQRSQHANRNQAMKMLKSLLYQMELDKRRQAREEMESEKKANEWGSQIRSYILHPYQMVKDHRTQIESSQPRAVLDGGITAFIEAELRFLAK